MRVLAAIALVALFAIMVVFFYPALRSPDEALQDFLGGRDRAEDQLADPLIVTGCRSAEIVVQHLSDESMPRRRYAIGYLGNRRCSVAVPALEGIARNENEGAYFRADAVEAISQIDQEKGRNLARSYAGRRDYLGQRSLAVLEGRRIGMSRTYWQAVRRVHE